MALSDKVVAFPNGLQISCAVLVSGLPYLWDDGLADWSGITAALDPGNANVLYTNKRGGLVGKPSGVVQQSNPLEPLSTGSGATFKLKDDGSRYLVKLFAVNNRGTVSTRLTSDQTTAAVYEEWDLQSTSGMTNGTVLYCGLETTVVDTVLSGTLVELDRGAFGSKRHPHVGTQSTTANAYTGPRVTTSPTIFKGRTLQLLVAYVSEGGVVQQYDVVWQGVLGKVSNESTHITLACDPLSDQVKKTEWPVQLAKGVARGGDNVTASINSDPDLWVLDMEVVNMDDPSVKARTLSPLGREIGGTFTRVTVAAGEYPVTTIYGWIRDTIIDGVRRLLNTASVPGTLNDFESNRFTITSTVEAGRLKVFYTNKTRFAITILATQGLGRWLAFGSDRGFFPDGLANFGFTFQPDTIGQAIKGFNLRGSIINKGDSSIKVVLDNPNNQFDLLSGWDGASTLGYASITQGDEREIVSFTTVTPDATDDRRVVLSGVLRGRAGTQATTFESSEDHPEPIVVQQIVMLEAVNTTGFNPVEVIGMLLGSTGIGAGVSGLDRLGWRYSPGLNDFQLDRFGIQHRLLTVADVPEVKTFYIDEQGKGPKALEEYLKFCGIYLIAKRYSVVGTSVEAFGISADIVDPPLPTVYNWVCTDSDRSATEPPKTDYNERLLINLFEYVPKLTFMSDEAFAADPDNPYRKWDRLQAINLYADDSISDYGIGQSLEIKEPTFIFERASHLEDVDTAREAAFVWAVLSANRWFAAFANGNYLLTAKVISPQGWRFQMGDRVRCRFTGITGPDGSIDFEAVGKVMKADQRFGDGCLIDFRLTYNQDGAELCPVATCTAHTAGNGVTLSTITWCDPDNTGSAGVPFPDNAESAKDWMWFDPINHTGADGLQVTVWRADNWAGREQKQVTALDKSTGKVTFNSALGATLQADITAGTTPVYMSFFSYAQLSPLRKLYAYVADNNYFLGASNEPAKEYM